MKKIRNGLLVGMIAGVIDVIPMFIQKIAWDANLSAFFMWIVIGFFISKTKIKVHPALKGLIVSFLVLVPTAVMIAFNQPISLIPITIMTGILGSLSGILINRLNKKR